MVLVAPRELSLLSSVYLVTELRTGRWNYVFFFLSFKEQDSAYKPVCQCERDRDTQSATIFMFDPCLCLLVNLKHDLEMFDRNTVLRVCNVFIATVFQSHSSLIKMLLLMNKQLQNRQRKASKQGQLSQLPGHNLHASNILWANQEFTSGHVTPLGQSPTRE